MVLDKYSHLKEELVKCIDSILTIESIAGGICEELRAKIENNVFNLVVLGQFKRGKTTLINALLGAEILPTAVVPLTSIATILTYGDTLNIKVYFNDGTVTEIEPASFIGGWLWDHVSPSITFYFGAITAGLSAMLFIVFIIAVRRDGTNRKA